MKKLLITGFDPFGKDDINPSYEAVKTLNDTIKNIKITKAQLPTEFIRAKELLIELIKNNDFDYVILTGQAAGRSKISLERVAINLMDARIEDNAGFKPKDVKVIDNDNAAYMSNIDIRKIEEALISSSIPTEISYSAGAYVCNSTYYTLMNCIEHYNLKTEGLFVHIPILPSQLKNYDKELASMDFEMIIKAFNVIIESLS